MNRIVAPLILVCASLFLAPQPASAITIATVPVGNVGNAGEAQSQGTFGGVAYGYRIGTTEVTVGQYTDFLNAVAATDTYALYNTSMTTNLNIAGISRSGASGSYSYGVIGSPNHPVTFVDWGDAARFSNWMHNNQPTGPQNASTTENGAYPLNGAIGGGALIAVSRNAGAQWFIPTENEWYKAAYHKNDGATGNYWDYPTSTDAFPRSDQPPGSDAPTQSNTANINGNDFLVNGYDDGYAVTGVNVYSSSQNYLTDAGAYTSSTSPYGTFDQGGNVREWNEALVTSNRGLRGGSWEFDSGTLRSSVRLNDGGPTLESNAIGFRVATVPVPGDVNFDGVVNIFDINFVSANWGGTGPDGDANGDMMVNIFDINLISANWTVGGAAATVPEPSTAVLAIVACGIVWWSRKRFK